MVASSSAYAAILRLRSSKARVWEGVGLARIVVGYASPKRTLLRVRLARSCRRVRKLWTGWPSSVRLRRAFRRAAGETLALTTGDERCAAAAAGLSSLNSIGARSRFMCQRSEEHTSELQSRGHL